MLEACECSAADHEPRLVVLTGGPGAGKTAVLEIVQRHFCRHVAVLPEAAGIIFTGGFPRKPTDAGRRMVQRAIYHTQTALQDLVIAERTAGIVLCDRGTLDGLAYWPGAPESFFAIMGTSPAEQLRAYAAVIHLRTPSAEGYHRNAVRIESASEALQIDERIAAAWEKHPRRIEIKSTPNFLDKAASAIEAIRRELPPCCRGHAVPELDKARSLDARS